MMDITFLVGFSEAKLLEIKTDAESKLGLGGSVPGQIVNSVSTRDLSVTYGGAPRSYDEIYRAARYALQKIDSTVYGTDLIRRKVKWIQ